MPSYRETGKGPGKSEINTRESMIFIGNVAKKVRLIKWKIKECNYMKNMTIQRC